MWKVEITRWDGVRYTLYAEGYGQALDLRDKQLNVAKYRVSHVLPEERSMPVAAREAK